MVTSWNLPLLLFNPHFPLIHDKHISNYSMCNIYPITLCVIQFPLFQIAYTSSDYLSQNKDRYPYFYSSIPSMSFFSGVKLQLLSDFQWRRVAVLSSDELADSQVF